jgi:pimeloyl-ACP methyl ester carboxylesterase
MEMRRFHRVVIAVWMTIGLGTIFVPGLQAQAPAHEGFADLPGVRIWYKDTGGSGVPVVFLHAGTGSSRVWEHQIPAFTAAGYRFIAYDRRGWGRSEVVPSGPQPGTAAEDLDRLMNHLKVDRFHIVATAAGGSIAWDYALSFSMRVRSMVIANNTGRVEDKAYLDFVASLRPESFDELPPEFREVGPVYRAANPEGTRRWVELEKVSRPPGPRMATQPLKNRLSFPLLESIEVPVLLISGGSDLAAPAPLQNYFSERVPHAETLHVPDAGHSTFWEQPEVFNRAVLAFIRKH